MKTAPHSTLALIKLFIASLLLCPVTGAEVATVPLGYTTLKIPAGDGQTRALTTLAASLYRPAAGIQGAPSGVIASVESGRIGVEAAGWSVGALSQESRPFVVRITSGPAQGRDLLVSHVIDNAVNSLTIDLTSSGLSNLEQLGIRPGLDTFELIECDTLGSLLGAPSDGLVIGAGEYDAADNVTLLVGGYWKRFYFDTELGRWTEFSRALSDATHMPLLAESGILYSRLAPVTSELVVLGTVPSTRRMLPTNTKGVTFLAQAWPVDLPLASCGIELLPEWTNRDRVLLLSEAGWLRFYYDGLDWREFSRANTLANQRIIPASEALILSKRNPAESPQDLIQMAPYSLELQ